MSHPDTAWSPNRYVGPRGVEGDPCRHYGQRQRVGPYSKAKTFMLLVDSCCWCGHIMRTAEDVSWQEYFWIRRSNARGDQ
jgi:hypothetical protein